MSGISVELQRLESAIVRLEAAVTDFDRRQAEALETAWQQSGSGMDKAAQRVDRAIRRLESVLEE
ncbi:MAG: hypothetical protein V3R98_12905 [Alphaproteobacteria bacterium]